MSGAKPQTDEPQAGDDRQQPAPNCGSGGPIDEQAALSQVLSEQRSEHGKARRRRANGKGI